MAVEDVAELTGKAVREVEVVFAEPVTPAAFEGVPGVSDVGADGKDAKTLRLTVTGSLDPVVKKLSAYPVVDLISRLPDLEDVFMTFYAEDGRPGGDGAGASGRTTSAAPRRDAEGGHDAA